MENLEKILSGLYPLIDFYNKLKRAKMLREAQKELARAMRSVSHPAL